MAEPLLDWEAHIAKLTDRQRKAIEDEAVEDEEAERWKEEERFRPGGDGFHKAKSSFEEGVQDQLASGASGADGADGASARASARASAGARVPSPPPSSLRSFAQKRMSGVREKLSGGNSARVTLDELRLHPQYDVSRHPPTSQPTHPGVDSAASNCAAPRTPPPLCVVAGGETDARL